ncbi:MULTISPECIES: Zn-ribbon domain-containing OB-fold protein [unclassified Pseudomonas]|uniref:Zn-ribbon domain-containing OB-fold protein n=1 Tax=unclassified Pseudomonas TaxID=196821 RepID=UPI0025E4DFC5|nr:MULTISPECIES: OB-fold domain-containing protein [unclassified Pseudomonas]
MTELNRFFWTGGQDGQLRFLHCSSCSTYIHPPLPVCPHCQGGELTPRVVSGQGRIEALTENHQAWREEQQVPYAIAIVSLDDQPGLQMTSNIVGCDPQSAYIGQQVRVVFEAIEDIYLPLFTPA